MSGIEKKSKWRKVRDPGKYWIRMEARRCPLLGRGPIHGGSTGGRRSTPPPSGSAAPSCEAAPPPPVPAGCGQGGRREHRFEVGLVPHTEAWAARVRYATYVLTSNTCVPPLTHVCHRVGYGSIAGHDICEIFTCMLMVSLGSGFLGIDAYSMSVRFQPERFSNTRNYTHSLDNTPEGRGFNRTQVAPTTHLPLGGGGGGSGTSTLENLCLERGRRFAIRDHSPSQGGVSAQTQKNQKMGVSEKKMR